MESLETELVSGDAGFAQRFAELKASVGDVPDVLAQTATVLCDGCGETADVDYAAPVIPEGWTEQEQGDFCARCSAGIN